MSQLEVYDATYDARKDAAEMLKAKAHGNQHVSRLQKAVARVWAHMMNTIQDKPVDAVLAPEAAPPKPQDMLCLQARRCLCNLQGRMECVLRDRLHRAIKAAFPQTLRHRLKNADVVACLFRDLPEEDAAAECTFMHIADCIFSPFMPGYHELCVADAAPVYMRRDGVDPSLLAVEDDASFELTSCFREHTDWEVVQGLSRFSKWEVAFFLVETSMEFVGLMQPMRLRVSCDDKKLHLLWNPAARLGRRPAVRGGISAWASLAAAGGDSEDSVEERAAAAVVEDLCEDMDGECACFR